MWSTKGGVGLSVTAAATAGSISRRVGSAVLVDLCGDLPALLGMAEPQTPGVRDWLAAEDASGDSLEHLLVPGPSGTDLLPVGAASNWSPQRSDELLAALSALGREVVIDVGVVRPEDVEAAPGTASWSRWHLVDSFDSLVARGRSLLVISSCYLALRRAIGIAQRADGLVVVAEPGRALTSRDIADLLSVPLVAQIDRDPAVARAVDAGMFLRRQLRPLESAVKGLVMHA